MKFLLLACISIVCLQLNAFSQKNNFSRADSLRGALRLERTCYDVFYYDLNLRLNVEDKYLLGYNDIHFEMLAPSKKLQIDLFEYWKVDSIRLILPEKSQSLSFEREHNAIFVSLPDLVVPSNRYILRVHYQGKPRIAPRAPWDGGFTFSKDEKNRPFIGVSCEGLGASVWWPNKDHLSEEPDSMRIYCEVPDPLICVSNGNLEETTKGFLSSEEGYTGYAYKVHYPINNYNVTLNIAHYAHFSETIQTDSFPKGLQADYYVLDYQLEKAKKHFTQVGPMLKYYEQLFGPYPYPKDGYALVETPYWGMEHQSAIAYGNNYQNLSAFKFDFIIIHESGHEYFGNSITTKDHADMWIHEAFTTYAELLYLELKNSYDFSVDYLQTKRFSIQNSEPILGPKDVNYHHWDGSDMYTKGAWMLHTLRTAYVPDDKKWLTIIHDFYQTFQHSHTDSDAVIDFFVNAIGKEEVRDFFYVYLKQASPPILEYSWKGKKKKMMLEARWLCSYKGFSLPIRIRDADNKWIWITPTTEVQSFSTPNFSTTLETDDRNFYFIKKQR